MIDITGKKYNRLTAVKFVYKKQSPNGSWKHFWLFKCDCGNTKVADKNAVKNGSIKSCGCQYREQSRKLGLSNRKFNDIKEDVFKEYYCSHNLAETAVHFGISVACVRSLYKKYDIIKVKNNVKDHRIYRIYNGIKARCYNKNNNAYMYYGERNIKMCDEWLADYALFENWALENGYSENLTIDRIDVNENYSPENCRWVDFTTQANNRRNNVFINFDGVSKTVSQWAKLLKTDYYSLYDYCIKGKQNIKNFISVEGK